MLHTRVVIIEEKMKMKQIIWLCSLLLMLGGSTAHAQIDKEFEARRIAYITKSLDLSPQEAQQFWPVYNAYKAELEQVQREKNRIQRGVRMAVQTKTDEELEKLSDEYIDLSVQQSQIQNRYHEEFKKVLPVRKVVLLYKTEQELNRRILEELRRRQEERLKNRR